MRSAVCAVAVAATALGLGCFRFTEQEAKLITEDTGVVADTGVDATTDAGPTMCDRFGGQPNIDKAMVELIAKLKTDCRVDRFFVAMAADRLQHMQECMSLQLAWIMRCPGVKYPASDSKGEVCRDVATTHKGLGIHHEDFDGMIDDILAVLSAAKMNAQDLAALSEVLRIQRTDIVNPGDAGRGDACLPETSAVDTGVDTGDY